MVRLLHSRTVRISGSVFQIHPKTLSQTGLEKAGTAVLRETDHEVYVSFESQDGRDQESALHNRIGYLETAAERIPENALA